jgi:hypothetical protein
MGHEAVPEAGSRVSGKVCIITGTGGGIGREASLIR